MTNELDATPAPETKGAPEAVSSEAIAQELQAKAQSGELPLVGGADQLAVLRDARAAEARAAIASIRDERIQSTPDDRQAELRQSVDQKRDAA